MAESINIDNCILKNIGLSGYGLLNIGKAGTLISIFYNETEHYGKSAIRLLDLRV